MKKFAFTVISLFACVLFASWVTNLPLWLVCFIPCVIGGLVVVFYSLQSSFEVRIRTSGIEAEAIITQSELYQGDGLNPSDACFRGRFEFFDAQGVRHVGSFSGHCYDPYDYLSMDKTLEFSLEYYYRVGGTAKVKYARQNPSKYIFLGPELTYIDNPSSRAE